MTEITTCCSTGARRTCCAPTDKAACCGTTAAQAPPATCGCAAGRQAGPERPPSGA